MYVVCRLPYTQSSWKRTDDSSFASRSAASRPWPHSHTTLKLKVNHGQSRPPDLTCATPVTVNATPFAVSTCSHRGLSVITSKDNLRTQRGRGEATTAGRRKRVGYIPSTFRVHACVREPSLKVIPLHIGQTQTRPSPTADYCPFRLRTAASTLRRKKQERKPKIKRSWPDRFETTGRRQGKRQMTYRREQGPRSGQLCALAPWCSGEETWIRLSMKKERPRSFSQQPPSRNSDPATVSRSLRSSANQATTQRRDRDLELGLFARLRAASRKVQTRVGPNATRVGLRARTCRCRLACRLRVRVGLRDASSTS